MTGGQLLRQNRTHSLSIHENIFLMRPDIYVIRIENMYWVRNKFGNAFTDTEEKIKKNQRKHIRQHRFVKDHFISETKQKMKF